MACVGFADFETKLCSISSKNNKVRICKQCNEQNCSHLSYTNKVETHELISYSLAFIDARSNLIFEKHYCGPNIEENFFNTLLSIEEKILLKTCRFKGVQFMKPLTEQEKNILITLKFVIFARKNLILVIV